MNFQFTFNPSKHNLLKAKRLAQYFTNIKIATFMANMISEENIDRNKQIRILDAGAGEGILGIQAVMRCIELGCKDIELTFYEIDEELHTLIQKHSDTLINSLHNNKIQLNIHITSEDFVLSRPGQKYDIAIINPPYFKYSVKESPYSNATSDLFKGNPNIYASFIAVCIASLATKGTLISITPRSFTNGLYFKGFRKFLYDNISFEHIHIFKSRDKVFKDAEVLQECIICKIRKNAQKDKITISSSNSDIDLKNSDYNYYDSQLIIDNSNDLGMLHIPETKNDAEILMKANLLNSSFEQAGYFISTGPVVEHRTREFILDNESVRKKRHVPLLRPHNIQCMYLDLDSNKIKNAYILHNSNSEKHLVKSKEYVLLKRFTTKDEKKRLIASVYSSKHSNSSYIGIGNKLNYVGVLDGKLSSEESLGLAAVFNSTFIDDYFRCFSGNTQVNASEVRVMKFPTRKIVQSIGKSLRHEKMTQITIDLVVMKNLFKVGNEKY